MERESLDDRKMMHSLILNKLVRVLTVLNCHALKNTACLHFASCVQISILNNITARPDQKNLTLTRYTKVTKVQWKVYLHHPYCILK